ncbi:flagellar hook protein FlgE [Stutzerimonas degradans]|uniref:Flagellar hook protein FlgE n=1 Tax=Stutzerimonas degradans TaxID=2968968 RepID=A0A8E2U4C5_9GAMM|nr:flagellar hook protein FlgE [Stutzerimonas degradans]MCF6753208.1 flagellar hook protein FlgE [Stutzerimonas stutzeri]MCQ4275225.1 flagellar hook protein FlgE [Stutzerimonas degradans]NHC11379.1 flagellar hook protein FlgE [Stutzerimonas degradans]PNF76199.1 flagellar hook protein FlgE [Stutzerimonas degradans]QPT21891.1 flagellar hook protein FlgE [Stutzerimonas degradans]
MSFNIGLSGLRAASKDLNVTGNNIANAGTVGFKQSRAEFSDVYAASVMGTGKNPQGSGVLMSNISQQFNQGNINYTQNALDLAINGNGFFQVSNNGAMSYTRAGYFGTDRTGFLVDNFGYKLQGYPVDANGNLQSGVVGDLQVQTTNQAPKATSQITTAFNLNSTQTSPATWQAAFNGAALAELRAQPGSMALSSSQIDDVAFDPVAWQSDLSTAAPGAGDFFLAKLKGIYSEPSRTPFEDGAGNLVDSAGYEAAIKAAIRSAMNAADTAVLADSVAVASVESIALPAAALTFDPADPTTYNSSTSLNIYDSQGNAHVMTQYFVKTGANTWDMKVLVDGRNPADPAGEPLPYVMGLTFNSAGALTTVSDDGSGLFSVDAATKKVTLNAATGNPPTGGWVPAIADGANWSWNGALANPGGIVLDFSKSSQYASTFAVNSVAQDGYTTGELAGLEIDDTGVIFARYTNGQSKVQGQIVLANFANVQGLTPVGKTQWVQSFESGEPVVGTPMSGTLGALQAGALEDSNVELSDQLVNLIVAQRNYQANAKTIETESAITQTIINLR